MPLTDRPRGVHPRGVILEEVSDAAKSHGVEAFESHSGRRWDYDSAHDELERRHGVQGAAAIIHDAKAAAAKLPKNALDWLE